MIEYRRRLPHIHPPDTFLFVTFRLWGSIPTAHSEDKAATGPRWLADDSIARVVSETIEIGECERRFYKLEAWAVLPTHVHILFLPKVPVPIIMRWLKGSTARRANQILGRTGTPFWRDESFDHYVRNQIELEKTVRYIEENPVAAGLSSSPDLWPWSSASKKAGGTACLTLSPHKAD